MVARAKSGGSTGGGVVDRIREGALGLSERVRSSAQAAAQHAVQTAGQLGEVVRDEAGRVIDAKRGKAASKIRKVSSAVDTAARLLRAGRIDGIAKYVDMAVDTAEHASEYVETRDFQSILEDLGELAKRHPVAVFGGVLATAFALGRLAKVLQEGESDADEDEDEETDEADDEDDASEDEDADESDEDEAADDEDEDEGDEDEGDEDEED